MKSIVLFLNKYKKIVITAAAVFMTAAIVLAVVLSNKSVRIKSALDSDNSVYNRVQIKITEKLTDVSPKTESENSTVLDAESANDTYFNQNGYYDEYGSFISDTASNADSEEDKNTTEYTITLKKDGDVYYEESLGGRRYYYPRNGKAYVLYYDDFYGIKKDDGDWVEAPAANYSISKSFDFDILKSIDRKKLHKQGSVYIPDMDYLDALFFKLLNINENNYNKYIVNSLSIEFEKGKIRQISASALYDNKYQMEETYSFTYNNTAIEVPQVDKVFGEE